VPACGIRVKVPRSFSSRESNCEYKIKSLKKLVGEKGELVIKSEKAYHWPNTILVNVE
jgi:hypothetical protein